MGAYSVYIIHNAVLFLVIYFNLLDDLGSINEFTPLTKTLTLLPTPISMALDLIWMEV